MSFFTLFRRLLIVAVAFSLVAAAAASGGDRAGIYRLLEQSCSHSHGCLHGKLARAAWRADDAAWDKATGRDLRNYPPDRIVDYLHMTLWMRFECINDRKFTARQLLRFTPIGTPTAAVNLNAVALDIQTVRMNGRDIEYAYDETILTVRFDPPLPVGEEYELEFTYVCSQPWEGLYFTPSCESAPHYTAEVHSQGQSETNRHWFIAHDFPNDMLTTELIVDVPQEFQVSSNGRLMGQQLQPDGLMRWHWLQNKPHVSYLVTLVIGQFDIVHLPHSRVSMKVWAPLGTGHLVEQTYGNTGAMLDLFERRFGIRYPWDRYDQLIVKNFMAGGMENTAATTMYPTAIFDETALLDRDLDDLIAHELAHQWTGNLFTCKSWEHIWLNEGWATFSESLWAEEREGEDGYLDSIRNEFRIAEFDKTSGDLPMVSPIYAEADDVFGRIANPYPKGASIIHMLRMMLGEDAFWSGAQLYMSRHVHQVVETSDFRYAMEEASGRGLEWFFEQWCYRPGAPELEINVQYDGAARELVIAVEQTQQIDARTPAFRFNLPVHVKLGDDWHAFTIDVRERSVRFTRAIDRTPQVVAVDPFLHVLKTVKETKPLPMWVAQLEHGPTIVARHHAIAGIGKHDSPENIARLLAVAANDSTRHTLRNTAVTALAGLASPEARQALVNMLEAGVAEAKVRSHLVRALHEEKGDTFLDRLAVIASTDPSYATRVAAIHGLMRHKSKRHADTIAELVHFRSQHEEVRSAALVALVNMDDPRGLELAIQYAAYGNPDRARITAVQSVGNLWKHDPDRAVGFLLPLLHDPERGTAHAAGLALARIGDPRAIPPMRALAETHRDPSTRRAAAAWVEIIAKPGRHKTESAPKIDAENDE
ncbi:MAG TPA: M1 family aminopeptidase [Phycisphaerales bacterium]|nr:M1 family aminopeptidase [Phycisphaerales bacterium]